jgi:hypothetical protein
MTLEAMSHASAITIAEFTQSLTVPRDHPDRCWL